MSVTVPTYRYCFFTTVKEEKLALYKQHHDNIFPEVAAGLRKAGVKQLLIFRQPGTNRQVMYIEMAGVTLEEALGEGSAYLTEDPVVPIWENLMKSFFEKDEWALLDEIHASDKQWNDSIAGRLTPLPPHPSAENVVLRRMEENAEIIALTEKLLKSICEGDYDTYCALCPPCMTAFEPEACGHLVQGLDFHKHYFDLAAEASKGGGTKPYAGQHTIAAPHVRFMGAEAAIICYTRLMQAGTTTARCEETRVWHKMTVEGEKAPRWQHVHFHRSSPKNSYAR